MAQKLARKPIIALTAHVAGADEAWRKCGMDDYITKPFTIESLSTVISHYIDISPSQAPDILQPTGCEETTNDAGPVSGYFDIKTLDEMKRMQSGDMNLPVRALELFSNHTPKSMRKLISSLNSGDVEEIRLAAHAVKSTSVNVGATALADNCATIESRATENASIKELTALTKTAAATFKETMAQLQDLKRHYTDEAA